MSSDIDFAIITENVPSILYKLQNFLHIKKTDIQPFVRQFTNKSNLLHGHKIEYKDVENNLAFDILIYDEKYRKEILRIIYLNNNLPLYILVMLYILKFCYYILCIIPEPLYLYLKNFIYYCHHNKQIGIFNKMDMTTIITLDT